MVETRSIAAARNKAVTEATAVANTTATTTTATESIDLCTDPNALVNKEKLQIAVGNAIRKDRQAQERTAKARGLFRRFSGFTFQNKVFRSRYITPSAHPTLSKSDDNEFLSSKDALVVNSSRPTPIELLDRDIGR